MKFFKLLSAGFGLGLLIQTAFAHHSTNGIYDETKVDELTGVVKEWRFINPHPSLIITVTDAAGQAHDWDVSYGGSAVVHLSRRGFKADSFKNGDTIKVSGNMALVEDAYGLLAKGDPTHADGSPIIIRP